MSSIRRNFIERWRIEIINEEKPKTFTRKRLKIIEVSLSKPICGKLENLNWRCEIFCVMEQNSGNQGDENSPKLSIKKCSNSIMNDGDNQFVYSTLLFECESSSMRGEYSQEEKKKEYEEKIKECEEKIKGVKKKTV